MFKSRQGKIFVSLLAVSVAQTVFVYLISLPLLGWFLSMTALFLFVRSQLVSKKPSDVLLKMLRMGLWVSLTFLYMDTLIRIFGYNLGYFLPGLIIGAIGLGVLAWHELSTERKQVVEHAITLVLVWLSLSWTGIGLAYYHWPVMVTLAFVWLGQFLIALWWAASQGERAEFFAAVWAVVVVEIVWVGSRWLSLYQLPKLGIILSQSSVLAISMGYSLGGLYYHRQNKKLTKPLVFEYFAITAIVFVLVIILTKWSNTQ